jgi:hypothetical protein
MPFDDNFYEGLGFDGADDALEKAIDNISEIAEKWSGDNANDIVARAIISSVRPMLESISSLDEAHPLLKVLAARHIQGIIMNVSMLDQIAALRNVE